jgi:hypothetical protein
MASGKNSVGGAGQVRVACPAFVRISVLLEQNAWKLCPGSSAHTKSRFGQVKGSVWNNSEDLYVGYAGDGTVNISDGGVVNVVGTTTLNNSTLHIELSDSTSGPSLFTDSLELGGTLEISLADGFIPELGNSFDILDFNTVSGSFAEMNLPALEGGLEWGTSQLLVDGTLYAGAIPLAGDFNYDGTVDAADYTVWQDNGGDDPAPLNESTP